MKVVFLYTELADYFLKCCEELAKTAEVHIIRWPVNKEAPFKFDHSEKIKIYNKNDYTQAQLKELLQMIDPQVISCSGWIDKDYLNLVRPWFGKVATVLCLDTHWRGSLKQYLATALSRFFLLNKFSHAWVPGKVQQAYAQKLGFKKDNIHTGFYCCDLGRFNAIYEAQFQTKKTEFPKRFIYMGRYYDFKGVPELWEAFAQLHREQPNEWQLWCLGTGSLEPYQHHFIKHFGFIQPSDLAPICGQTGVFILPSRFEPWGVVVQEFAAAGFPLLLSEAVGARQTFLEENVNGFSFPAWDKDAILDRLKKIVNLSAKELILMGENSHRLSGNTSPKRWANTVKEIYGSFKKN